MTSRRILLSAIAGVSLAAGLRPTRARTEAANAPEVSVKTFGAAGDGVTDDTDAIQRGIDATSTKGIRLVFPGGTYRVIPKGALQWAGGVAIRTALHLRSGIDLAGLNGATIKIADGVSSNAAPVDMAMFLANDASGPLSNITMRGLRLDMNGEKNRQAHGRRNHAHIHVTGNHARAEDVLIEDCAFLNTAGTSCVVAGQITSGTGYPLSRRWTIRRCHFAGNGIDTADHSSIFGWGEQITVEDCDFQSGPFDPVLGNAGNTACEIHGADSRFIHNVVHGGWLQGVWVAENATAEGKNILVANNVMRDIGSFGIAFFGHADPSMLVPVRSATITNNAITLNAARYPGIDVKAGICVASAYSQQGWMISGNTIRVDRGMTTASAGVLIVGGRAGQKHSGTIKLNSAYGTTFGVALFTYAAGGIGTVIITGNRAYSPAPAGSIFKEAAGVLVSGGSAPIDNLTLLGNYTINHSSPPFKTWGLHLKGRIESLRESNNQIEGSALLPKQEDGLTVAHRIP